MSKIKKPSHFNLLSDLSCGTLAVVSVLEVCFFFSELFMFVVLKDYSWKQIAQVVEIRGQGKG